MSDLVHAFDSAEEASHAITHGVGAIAAVGLTVYLVNRALDVGDVLDVLAVLVFGVSMAHLYAASALCHALPEPSRTQAFFESLDFLGIYALIAGTYTPFMLGPLRGAWGYGLLAAAWGLALLGMSLELGLRPRRRRLALGLYLGMGWMGLIAVFPLSSRLPVEGLTLLFAGGLAYTVGVVFFVWRAFRFHHTVWHLFVLLGSGLHAWAVARYALPLPIGP